MDNEETLPVHKTRKATVEDGNNDNMFVNTELEELPDLVDNSNDEETIKWAETVIQ